MINLLPKNLILLLISLFFLASCVNQNKALIDRTNVTSADNSATETEEESVAFENVRQQFNLFEEYRIIPGDVLDVFFKITTVGEMEKDFKLDVDHEIQIKFVDTPELNEQQIIRPDGTVSLPYLGTVYVIGKTLKELTEELNKRYSKILQHPNVYITVPDFRARIREIKTDLRTAPRGLSKLLLVRPDGYCSFPMLGTVFVAGKTVPEVNKELNTLYHKTMPGLQCDLFLEKHSGFVIYVVGEVNRPGAYNILKPITVIEALALAGGYTQGAKLNSLIVARRTKEKMVATQIGFKKLLNAEEDLVLLRPDDIVYVPKTFIRKAADVMKDLAQITLFRGWGTSLGFSWELRRASESREESTRERTDGGVDLNSD